MCQFPRSPRIDVDCEKKWVLAGMPTDPKSEPQGRILLPREQIRIITGDIRTRTPSLHSTSERKASMDENAAAAVKRQLGAYGS